VVFRPVSLRLPLSPLVNKLVVVELAQAKGIRIFVAPGDQALFLADPVLDVALNVSRSFHAEHHKKRDPVFPAATDFPFFPSQQSRS